MRSIGSFVILAALLCRCHAAAAAALPENLPAAREPVVLWPADKQHVGTPDDPLCERDQACSRIRAEGRVPANTTPFFAVEPVAVSPRMWIQPRIHRVKRDGSFSGLVNLGEAHKGAKQWFKIYVFACANPNRFREGDEIVKLPDDCAVSDPVEVYRER
ncbi:MAG TPA: hypothetical protein VI670_25035 [Thermoanaerobaculia bacterium]|jgi:hypothetical protein